ncbi:hypothetical protein JCM21900_003029 [Sporobolomyces salmonicolor]
MGDVKDCSCAHTRSRPSALDQAALDNCHDTVIFLAVFAIASVGILTPLLHTASITVFCLLSSNNYSAGIQAYKAVDSQLLVVQDAWNWTFDAWFARTFYLYLAWSSLCLVLFVLMAGLYIRALRKTVQDFYSQDLRTANIPTCGVERKTIDPFRKTMKALSWVTVPFVIVCSASVANFTW